MLAHPTVPNYRLLALAKGYVAHSKITTWLMEEFELSRGHATRISRIIAVDNAAITKNTRLDRNFDGAASDWRPAYDELSRKVTHFGNDILIEPSATLIHLMRGTRRFGIIQITTAKLIIGIALPGELLPERYKPSGNWNHKVSHRIDIILQQQIDDELIHWLRKAYDNTP